MAGSRPCTIMLDQVVLGIRLGHEIDGIFHPGAAALLDPDAHALGLSAGIIDDRLDARGRSLRHVIITAKPMGSSLLRQSGSRPDVMDLI